MNTNIKYNFITAAIFTIIFVVIFSDIIEAQAGRMHRATRRRTAIVVSSVTHEKDQEAAAQQQATQEQAPPPADATTTAAPATTTPPPTTPEAPLPIGTVVSKLPEGCVTTPVDDVQYYHCGANYYRAVYQENNLVYVTTDPPQ